MSSNEENFTGDQRAVGRLLIIGGAEDAGDDPKEWKILPYFVKLAGGKAARIIVCGTPSSEPEDTEREYKEAFEKLGVAEVTESKITERNDALDTALLEKLDRATGVFFSGGDQLRLTSLIAGTTFGEKVRQLLWERSLVVAGTSAGAAAMSSTMVVGGRSDGGVRRADVELAPGFGYMRDTTIDTHFSQRGRVSRMLTVVAQNPQVITIGIDENTAIDVKPGSDFVVIGEGSAYVLDGRVTHSNASEVDEEEYIALTDSVVHVLPAGYGFDMRTKRPLLPDGTKIEKR